MCEARLPTRLEKSLEAAEQENQPAAGTHWAGEQVQGLLKGGSPGFHLYALNKSASTLAILEGIGRK
jgi:methylenetetrahydrofolate reductase (NADPH)